MFYLAKSKHANGGAEPRVTKIIQIIRSPTIASDVAKEAVKSLINYAEVNAKLIFENSGIEAILSHFTTHMQV